MIHDGLANVLPRTDDERRLAELKGFESDVRLACQTRVTGPVAIRRLVFDAQDAAIAVAEKGRHQRLRKAPAITSSATYAISRRFPRRTCPTTSSTS